MKHINGFINAVCAVCAVCAVLYILGTLGGMLAGVLALGAGVYALVWFDYRVSAYNERKRFGKYFRE